MIIVSAALGKYRAFRTKFKFAGVLLINLFFRGTMGDYGDVFMRNKDAAAQARTKAQNRATVLQLKLIGQSHPTGLTSNLLKLFEPRPPLEFKPPPEKRKLLPYTGMAQFVNNFADPGDPEYAPPVPEVETPLNRSDKFSHRQFVLFGFLARVLNLITSSGLRQSSRGKFYKAFPLSILHTFAEQISSLLMAAVHLKSR